MTLLRTQLGNSLRSHRLSQRRTLRDVSGAARVSLGYLSEVERGQKEASSELLASICEALELELADLLAEGIRDRCTATWGVGLTGVAGPDPLDGHGPGRVYLGLADGRRTDVVELDLPGDRAAVRAGAVAAAVAALLARVAGGTCGNDGSARGVTP